MVKIFESNRNFSCRRDYTFRFVYAFAYIAQKTKDAIVDKFRETDGVRPNVDLKFPDVKINVHIDRRKCTISLDSSGDSLHKRGYKTATNIAPINEVLAAGLIMLSGWDGQTDFMDPMCGSGTMLIEAAMIACNIPPNLMRKEFAFERWPDWDVELFEKIEESLLKKTRDFHHKIIGFDKAPSAVTKAKENVLNAQLDDFIEIKQQLKNPQKDKNTYQSLQVQLQQSELCWQWSLH